MLPWVYKVRGQSEETLQTGMQAQLKGLISAEAKKLLYQKYFNFLNDIQ